MTIQQVRQHIESDMEIWKNKKSELWIMKEQKIDGSKTSWKEANIRYSSNIQTLQDILIFIDTNQDGPYWCEGVDENGNKIEMTKVKLPF